MPTAEAAPECTKCLNYGKTDGSTVHGTKKRKLKDPWTCYVVLLTQALCISTADAQVRRFKPSAAIDGQLLHFGSAQDVVFSGVAGLQTPFRSGACGYGIMPPSEWPGLNIASISPSNPLLNQLSNNGCGACIEIQCTGEDCIHTSSEPASVVVYVADICSSCNATQASVDFAVFSSIADVNAGSTPVRFRQVNCHPKKSIQVKVDLFEDNGAGNTFIKLVVKAVAGVGTLKSVELSSSADNLDSGTAMLSNTFGAAWQADGIGEPPYDLFVVDDLDREMVIRNAVTPGSSNGRRDPGSQIFETGTQFHLSPTLGVSNAPILLAVPAPAAVPVTSAGPPRGAAGEPFPAASLASRTPPAPPAPAPASALRAPTLTLPVLPAPKPTSAPLLPQGMPLSLQPQLAAPQSSSVTKPDMQPSPQPQKLFPTTLITNATEQIVLVDGNQGPTQLGLGANRLPKAHSRDNPLSALDNIVSVFPGVQRAPQPGIAQDPAFSRPQAAPAPAVNNSSASPAPLPAQAPRTRLPAQPHAVGLGSDPGCIGSGEVPSVHILLQQLGSYRTFLRFAQEIGLLDLLQNPLVSATVFAPTEQAFVVSAATASNMEKLSLALTNSVSLGRRDIDSIKASIQSSSGQVAVKLQTLSGGLIAAAPDSNGASLLLELGGSRVLTSAPMQSCRCIVYPIGQLLTS